VPAAPRRSAYSILLVAEDPLARFGLQSLVAGEPSLEVVAQLAPDAVEAAVRARRPDAIVWDLGADVRAGIQKLPGGEAPAVVALVPDDRGAGEALLAGARAVLPRDASAPRLAAAVAAAVEGLIAVDDTFEGALSPSRGAAAPSEDLTPREQEVLHLLAEGLSNKGIAQRLGISEHTAKFHVNAILSKLGAQTRTDAVVRAARLGLVLL